MPQVLPSLATKPKKKSGGFNLGVGNLFRELGSIPTGLATLGTAWLPGGTAAGEVYSRAAKGITSSFAGTAATFLPGTGMALKPLTRRFLGEEFEAQTLQDIARDPNRGLLSGLVENIGNVALGAGTAKQIISRGGSAATKIAAAERAVTKAGRIGLTEEAIGRAQQAGRAGGKIFEPGAVARKLGAQSPETGISGRFGDLGQVAKTARRAEGLTAPADDVARAGRRLGALDVAAHPYIAASQRGARPLAKAATQAGLGDEFLGESAKLADARDAAPTRTGEAMSAAAPLPEALSPQRAPGLDLGGPEGIAPATGQATRNLESFADMPVPDWAKATVAKLPPGAAERLAKLDARYQRWDLKKAHHETRRFMQTEQRALFRHPAVTASKAAADALVEQFGHGPEEASRLVGDQLMAELSQTAMLDKVLEMGLPQGGTLWNQVQEAMGRKYLMKGEELASVRPMLDEALGQWKALNEERTQRLVGGRLGEQGIEGALADSPDLTPDMTPAQQRKFNQLVNSYKRTLKQDGPERRALETHAKARLAKESELDRLGSQLAATKQAIDEGRANVIEEALPASLRGEARAATAATLHQVITANPEGFTLDFNTGALLDEMSASASVGIVGEVIPAGAAATPEGVAAFIDKYLPMMAHQDAKVGGWMDDAGNIHLDVAQTTINGRRLTREEAYVLGAARGEKAIWDFNMGQVDMPSDAVSMAVAAQHAADLYRPSSQFKRWLGQVNKVRENMGAAQLGADARKVAADAHDERVQMQMRFATARLGAGRVKSLDEHYAKLATEYEHAFDPSNSPLRGFFQLYLSPTFDPANTLDKALWDRALRYMGPEADAAINWYYRAHETVAARYGDQTISLPRNGGVEEVNLADFVFSLMAITSKDASPIANANMAMQGVLEAVDYAEASKWTEAIAGGIEDYKAALLQSKAEGRLVGASPVNQDALFKAIAAKVGTRFTDVRANIMEVITGRLVKDWDAPYLIEQMEQKQLARIPADAQKKYAKLSAKARAGKSLEQYTQERMDAVVTKNSATRALYEEVAAAEGHETADRMLMEAAGSDAYAKIRSFEENLRNPSNDGVTLDRVMANILGLQNGNWSAKGAYESAAQATRALADQVSMDYFGQPGLVKPHQVQALLWVYTKKMLNETELGRMYPVGLDAMDSLDDVDLYRLGGDPISLFLKDEIAQSEHSGIKSRDVGVITPEAAAASLFGQGPTRSKTTINQHVPSDAAAGTKSELGKLQARADAWAKDSEKIQAHLDAGNRAGAEQIISSWMAEQAKRFVNDPEEYEMFLAGNGQTRGIGPVGLTTLDRLRSRGLLPDARPEIVDPGQRPALTAGEIARNFPDQEPLFQKMGADVNGLTFLGDDGRVVTRFFQTADATTLVHEDAHALRMMLAEPEVRTLERAYRAKAGTTAFEERFANDMLRHMLTQAPPVGLEDAFNRIRNTLSMFWQGQGDNMLRNVDPDVSAMLSRYLEPDLRSPGLGAPKMPATEVDVAFEGKTPGQIARAIRPDEGATPAQTMARGRKVGAAAAKLDEAKLKAAKLAAQQTKTQRALDRMGETMNASDTAPGAARQKTLNKLRTQMSRLVESSDTPGAGSTRVPAHWKPLYGAMQNLRELSKTSPELAALLDDVPETFSGFVEYALDKGLDPTHVASLSDTQVRKLVYGQLDVADSVVEAATRHGRTGTFADQRSIEALMAAQLDVVREAHSNQLVTTVERSLALPIADDAVIPQGYELWSPTNPYMRSERAADSAVRSAVGQTSEQKYVLPKSVANYLREIDKDYSHSLITSFQKRVTQPWRSFVLTLSPRWYVNNVMGNAILATKAGVGIGDWAKAYRQWRNADPTYNQFVGEGLASKVEFGSGESAQTLVAPKSAKQLKAEGSSKLTVASAKRAQIQSRLQRANSAVDEIARSAVYNSQTRKGFSPEHALQKALTAMVDYSNLGPLEKGLVRAVIPFYSWQKGIFNIVKQLPLDHPAATAVLMQYGQMQQEMFEDLPEAYRHQLNIPGLGDVNVRGFNPFADAAALTSPQGIANSAAPFVEAIVRNALDAPDTGYPEQYRVDEIGRAMPSTALGAELAGAVTTGLPQARALGLGEGQQGPDVSGFFGFKGLSDERQDVLRARQAKSEAKVQGMTPTEAGLTEPKPKRSALSKQLQAQIPRPKLQDLRGGTLGS